MISLYLSTLFLWTCTDANKKSQTFHNLILILTEQKCYEHFICIMYQYAMQSRKISFSIVFVGQTNWWGCFQYQSVKVLQCHHPSYNFKCFLKYSNKTTFGFLASNVSKMCSNIQCQCYDLLIAKRTCVIVSLYSIKCC